MSPRDIEDLSMKSWCANMALIDSTDLNEWKKSSNKSIYENESAEWKDKNLDAYRIDAHV